MKIVQTDARFSTIRTQKPFNEVVSFFQTLFVRLIEKWIHAYPDDVLKRSDTFTAKQTEYLKSIVAETEYEYVDGPFVCAFFKDALQLCKRNLSSPLYEEVLLHSLEETRSQHITYFPGSDKIAVIMDPRYDDLMEAVIRNFMHFLNRSGWNLMIFSAFEYKERIMSDFPTCLFVPISNALMSRDANGRNPNISIDSYNHMLLSESFWQSIPANHIAIFQKDCIMYSMFDETLFLSYDFAGANFFHDFAGAPISGGINGGFSLRNKKAMIECIQSVSWDTIIGYNTQVRPLLRFPMKPNYTLDTRNEDVFFTNACEILGKRMPDVVLRNRLAIEVGVIDKSIVPSVYHGWNKNYHSLETAISLLSMSPFFMKYIHNVSD